MIELLTGDTAIVIFSCAGLLATAISIVRDTRSARERMRSENPTRTSADAAGPTPLAERREIAA